MQELTVRDENSSEIVTLTINHIFDETQADIVALAIFAPSAEKLFIRAGINIGQKLVAGIREDMDRLRGGSTQGTEWKGETIMTSAPGETDLFDDISELLRPYGDRVVVNEDTTLVLARYYIDKKPAESRQEYIELMKSVLKVFFDKLALRDKMSSPASDGPRMLSFLANFKGGFVITGQDGRISLIDRKAKAMFRKESVDLNQREISTLGCDELTAAYQEAHQTGESVEKHVTTSRSRYYRVFISPIEDVTGYKVGRLLLISDATEETRIRRIVVHDLKNQINPIQARLQDAHQIAMSITTGGEAAVRLEEKIKQICLEFSRYSNQINDLNYLEHMKLRREALNKGDVDLSRIIRDLIRLYKPEAKDKGIKLKAQLLEKCMMKTDEKAIASVFRNLISNSIGHNKAVNDGWVEVEMKEEGENVIVTVSNTGKLSEGVRKTFRMGEPFSTSGAHGFGLYMAREFVLEHGGTIDLDSGMKNGESIITFTVKLPGRLK